MIEEFLVKSPKLWHKDVDLLKIGTRDELNELYLSKKIEVRDSINGKVIRLIK